MINFGDYVECTNCGFKGLVPYGGEECPHCHMEGSLAWASDNADLQECSAELVGEDLLRDLEQSPFAVTNEKGELLNRFLHFPKGTNVADIRRYIEKNYGVAKKGA